MAARQLRWGAQGRVSLEQAVVSFLEAWRVEIQPHFRAEEELLLPLYARAVPADDPFIVRVLTEHVALRRAVWALERATADEWPGLAQAIGTSLDDHIRFEERVLFPAVESALEGAGLAELGHELCAKA
jgi:hemerythrin-like domain-containing protein